MDKEILALGDVENEKKKKKKKITGIRFLSLSPM